MSSYTMQLREYIEMFSQSEELPVRNRIDLGRQHLFDFDYPFFDEDYRNVFETNFIRNFYMREIGFESEGLFKFNLETWLLINMPYFNKLFESELLQYDPLTNVASKITYSKTDTNERTETKDKTGNVVSADKTHDAGSTTQNTTGHEDIDSTMNKTIDSTSQNDVTQHSSSVSDTDQTTSQDVITDSNTDNTSHQTTNVDSDSTENKSGFNRGLTSDTPDSRLAITTNEGSGVIEYASEIKENTETDSTTSNSTSDTVSDTTSNQKNKTTSSNDGTLDSKTTNTSDEKVDNDTTIHSTEKDVFTSDKDNTETVTGSHTNDGTKDSTIDSTGNEKVTATIKNVEDYLNSKIGKHGSASYPQLVKEYRESLLRVEKQIFNEMNELFMLVY